MSSQPVRIQEQDGKYLYHQSGNAVGENRSVSASRGTVECVRCSGYYRYSTIMSYVVVTASTADYYFRQPDS